MSCSGWGKTQVDGFLDMPTKFAGRGRAATHRSLEVGRRQRRMDTQPSQADALNPKPEALFCMWTLSCWPQTPRLRTAARDAMISPATSLDILQTEVQLEILTR